MEKDSRKFVLSTTPIIMYLVILSLLYLSFFGSNKAPLLLLNTKAKIWSSSSSSNIVTSDGSTKVEDVNPTMIIEHKHEHDESMKFPFTRLVGGEDREQLEEKGFGCHTAPYSEVCVANRPISIDTRTMTVYVTSNKTSPLVKRTVHPYARREDPQLMSTITPVHMLHGNITPPPCDVTHSVPAVIFSSAGFFGNQFHEYNEIIIPLFLTSHLFQSNLKFLIVDFKPSFVRKYEKVLSHLSNYDVINPGKVNGSVHCFPGAVIGLHFHAHLAINSTDLPIGYSMFDFKQFLREAYNLRYWTVSEMERPVVGLVSRSSSRTFLNEEEMVGLMEELGFRVVVIKPRKMSDLGKHSKLINSCSVLVGTHGAGLSHEVFLPNGAVVIQVVPMGLEWASAAYFGEPAPGMGLEYLEYRIEPEESSLYKLHGKDSPVMRDPGSVFTKSWEVGRAVYVDSQHVRVDLVRFRKTLNQALTLLGP